MERLIDIAFIAVSGMLSFGASTSRFHSHSHFYREEWSGIGLVLYPIFITGLLIVAHLVASIATGFYNKYRWWMVGFFCAVNLLTGLMLRLGIIPA